MGKRKRNKGSRRAHLKRFSSEYVNAGRINRGNVMYYESQYSRGRYHSPDVVNYADHPPTDKATCGPDDTISTRLGGLWQSPFWQGCNYANKIRMTSRDRRIVEFLVFTGQRFSFIREFLESVPDPQLGINGYDTPKGTVQYSRIIYSSEEMAREAYKHGTIPWTILRNKPGQ